MSLDWQALAVTETPAARLRILEFVDESGEPQSPTSVSKGLRLDLRICSYHLHVLERSGLVQLDHVGEAPGRQHFFVMAGAEA